MGVATAAVLAWLGYADFLGANQEWVRFLAATGAVFLTFLAGAELDPDVLRTKLTEVTVVGVVSFAAPFSVALRWRTIYLGGVSRQAGSAASRCRQPPWPWCMRSMLETGFNKTDFGKGILGACFITDLGTVIALGLLFSPFTYKTSCFHCRHRCRVGVAPHSHPLITTVYAHRTAAIRTKWIMLVLFGLGALALWSGSEAVLPAYIAGMVLAGSAARDAHWIRRLRTLTVGFLTPFYFLRAGTLVVSLPALLAAPLVFVTLLGGKVLAKIFGLYPVIALFRRDRNERWYYTLMMSTGLDVSARSRPSSASRTAL